MKRKARRIAIVAAMLAIFIAAFFVRTESPVVDLPTLEAVKIQVDTPPPLEPAPGWPFEELPLVAKFGAPVPQVGLVSSIPHTLFEQALARHQPTAPPPPPDHDPSSLWLLSPLAAGAFVVGSDAVTTIAIPEPSALFLLSTGLLLIGLKVIRRRRGKIEGIAE